MKAAAISAGITVVIIVLVLVAREMMMKRGADPVGRIADTILPRRPAPTAPATPTV